MAQTSNTFVEELQKLYKNLSDLEYMPGVEQHLEWLIKMVRIPIGQKLQELHGVGGQFPGQPPGGQMGAGAPTPDPAQGGMPPGMPPGMGGPPPGMMPGGPPGGMPPGMEGAMAGPSPQPGPPPNMNAQTSLPPTTEDMLANLRGGG